MSSHFKKVAVAKYNAARERHKQDFGLAKDQLSRLFKDKEIIQQARQARDEINTQAKKRLVKSSNGCNYTAQRLFKTYKPVTLKEVMAATLKEN
jgi:hypothetical protein